MPLMVFYTGITLLTLRNYQHFVFYINIFFNKYLQWKNFSSKDLINIFSKTKHKYQIYFKSNYFNSFNMSRMHPHNSFNRQPKAL